MTEEIGPFHLDIDAGVATATFDRPPVNAIDVTTYRALAALTERVRSDDEVRVLVLTAPEEARCWCGGADLNDFVGMDPDRRRERYQHVNDTVPGFAALDKPVIGSLTGHAVGVGVLLAGICDFRIASEDALMSTPEGNYGLVSGSSDLLLRLGLPQGLVREMAYAGTRVSADRMLAAGFFNEVVPRSQVLARSQEIARDIAAKSLPVLRARKAAFIANAELGWFEAYQSAQEVSAHLVAMRDAGEGVNAFLEGRSASISDD